MKALEMEQEQYAIGDADCTAPDVETGGPVFGLEYRTKKKSMKMGASARSSIGIFRYCSKKTKKIKKKGKGSKPTKPSRPSRFRTCGKARQHIPYLPWHGCNKR
jgi:hypothetical protein